LKGRKGVVNVSVNQKTVQFLILFRTSSLVIQTSYVDRNMIHSKSTTGVLLLVT